MKLERRITPFGQCSDVEIASGTITHTEGVGNEIRFDVFTGNRSEMLMLILTPEEVAAAVTGEVVDIVLAAQE